MSTEEFDDEAFVSAVRDAMADPWDSRDAHMLAVLKALRALPVGERMEAMGMVERRASFDGQTFKRCWTEDYS